MRLCSVARAGWCRLAGATESQVSDIERAQNNPGWILVARLLDGLDATVAELADAYSRAQRGELDSGS
jgi:transcriptional regulator with XRE-family HTH domain